MASNPYANDRNALLSQMQDEAPEEHEGVEQLRARMQDRNTGIAGGGLGSEVAEVPESQFGGGTGLVPPADAMGMPGGTAEPAPGPDYTKLGQYGLEGYNMDKFNRPYDQLSEKYRIGLIQSHFDPTKGVTPEFIDALNKANIYGAKFAGSGDKLNVVDTGGHERFGQGGIGDIVRAFKTGKGAWKAWEGPQDEGGGGGMPQASGMSSLAGLLPQGIPGVEDQKSKTLENLLAEIERHSRGEDRNALMAQMQ